MSVDHWSGASDTLSLSECGIDPGSTLKHILEKAHAWQTHLPQIGEEYEVTAVDGEGAPQKVKATRMPATVHTEAGYRFVSDAIGTLLVTGQYTGEGDITTQVAHVLLVRPDGTKSRFGWKEPLTGSVPNVGEESRPAIEAGLWIAGLTPQTMQRAPEAAPAVATRRPTRSRRR